MNPANIKSVDEIAADLRAKGELDEGKYLKLKKQPRELSKLLYGLSIFLVLGSIFKAANTEKTTDILGALFAFLIAYYFIFVMLKNSFKENLIWTYLLSYGVKHKAKLVNIRRGGMGFVELTCFASIDGHNIQNKFMVSGNILDLYEYPEIGDDVDIIYDKNHPSLFRFYNEKANNLYCLRRE